MGDENEVNEDIAEVEGLRSVEGPELTEDELAAIQQDPEEGAEKPAEADEQVPLTDERSQHQIDLALLYGAVRQAREELATAKLAYHLSKAGIEGGKHPNQQADIVKAKVKQLDVILTLVKHVEDSGEGIPKPSKIEIAGPSERLR